MKLTSFKYAFVGGLLAVIAAAIWMLTDNTPPPSSAVVVESVPAPAASEPDIFPPGLGVAIASPEPPPDLPPPKPRVVISPEAVKEMNDVQFMLRDFRARLGGNPGGTNAEIMAEVMGKNRVQAKFSVPEGQQLNEKGELVDRWGTPYFFHQISMNEMELLSFGPDKALGTSDDIVVK